MAYPQKLLAPDEHVKFEMRPHWRGLIGPILILIATVFIGTFLFVSAPWAWLQWVVGGVMALLILWPALVGFLRWVTTDYVFTDRRVIVRSGIVTKRGRDVPLSKINNVSFGVPALGRILNYGALDIQSAGENEGLHIADVPNVEQIQRDIYELTERDDVRRRGTGPSPASDGT